MAKPDDELVYELTKIVLFLRECSTQHHPLDRTQRDIAKVSADWLQRELIGPAAEKASK